MYERFLKGRWKTFVFFRLLWLIGKWKHVNSVHWTPIILWPRLWWFLLCIRNLNPHLRFLGISSVLPHCQEVALSKYATSLKYVWSIHFSPFLRRGPITMSKIVPVVLSTPHIMHRITKPKPKFATSRLYPERRRSLEELEINLNLNKCSLFPWVALTPECDISVPKLFHFLDALASLQVSPVSQWVSESVSDPIFNCRH